MFLSFRASYGYCEISRGLRQNHNRLLDCCHTFARPSPLGYLKRVIVTPAVYPRFIEFLHFDIQSTGQKSHCVNTKLSPSQCFVLIKQSDSPGPYQFWVNCSLPFAVHKWYMRSTPHTWMHATYPHNSSIHSYASPQERNNTGPTYTFALASPVASVSRFNRATRIAQSSEPILIPKLRIYFADFPYLRYSIGQRLFTLETCCGYGYDFARNLHTSLPDFQGPTQALRMAQDLCHF